MISMKKLLTFFLLVAMVGIMPTIAQNERSSFEDFRKEVKGNFQKFRKKVFEDYDKYLDGIWKEYNAFKGEERNPIPKPKQVPVAENAVPPQPQSPKTSPPKEPEPQTRNSDKFLFYGLDVTMPSINVPNTFPAGKDQKDYAKLWKVFSNHKIEKHVLPALLQIAVECNLNDWFIFELIRQYVNTLFDNESSGARISLLHYLLTHVGYDVRIGMKEEGIPVLFIAFEQKVYARGYCIFNGVPYYIFYDIKDEKNVSENSKFYTCDIPTNIDNGKKLNLLIQKDIIMPNKPEPYHFSYKGLTIQGTLNVNMVEMLRHYPQMPIECYAKSIIDTELRKNIIQQLKSQLQTISIGIAIDTILQFVQYAFQYATDDEQHGFEKPYFFEEILYYPQCDCEDRSVFYSYLLWEVLNVENHLIEYPGHECVAVYLENPIEGHGYRYDNKTFYISDPTYIGATTGMCMPDFINNKPKIELSR